jgi:hypothetical protein
MNAEYDFSRNWRNEGQLMQLQKQSIHRIKSHAACLALIKHLLTLLDSNDQIRLLGAHFERTFLAGLSLLIMNSLSKGQETSTLNLRLSVGLQPLATMTLLWQKLLVLARNVIEERRRRKSTETRPNKLAEEPATSCKRIECDWWENRIE